MSIHSTENAMRYIFENQQELSRKAEHGGDQEAALLVLAAELLKRMGKSPSEISGLLPAVGVVDDGTMGKVRESIIALAENVDAKGLLIDHNGNVWDVPIRGEQFTAAEIRAYVESDSPIALPMTVNGVFMVMVVPPQSLGAANPYAAHVFRAYPPLGTPPFKGQLYGDVLVVRRDYVMSAARELSGQRLS